MLNLNDKSTITATAPFGGVSSKYSMASTGDMLRLLESKGWFPEQYRERRVMTQERSGKQAHTIVLANEGLNKSLMVSGTQPRIMLKNSHDGSSSLQLLSGLFERICANGLIVGSRASDIRIRHLSLTPESLIKGVEQAIGSLEAALNISQRMSNVMLEKQQQLEMAQEVIEMAWDGEKYSILPNQILWNHRREQRVPTLWNTFNTIQEHVIRGGVTQYRKDGTRIRSREVKAIDRSIELNRNMWDIAERRLIQWT